VGSDEDEEWVMLRVIFVQAGCLNLGKKREGELGRFMHGPPGRKKRLAAG